MTSPDASPDAPRGGVRAAKRALRAAAPGLFEGAKTGWHAARQQALRLIPDRVAVNRLHLRHRGRKPDLAAPAEFGEKIAWLTLFGMTDLHRRCTDKIAVRGHVAERVGEHLLAPLILTAPDPAGIAPDRIPHDRFVAKTSHDCGGVVICRDRAAFDWAAARAFLRDQMRWDYSLRYRELQYRGIRPAILVEEYVPGLDGHDAEEVKIYCFHGRARMIQVHRDRFGPHTADHFLPDWTPLPVRRIWSESEAPPPRPERLDELIAVAEALAEPFAFVRADLFSTPAGVFFSELTFTPDAGLFLFEPRGWERTFGDLIDLGRIGGPPTPPPDPDAPRLPEG